MTSRKLFVFVLFILCVLPVAAMKRGGNELASYSPSKSISPFKRQKIATSAATTNMYKAIEAYNTTAFADALAQGADVNANGTHICFDLLRKTGYLGERNIVHQAQINALSDLKGSKTIEAKLKDSIDTNGRNIAALVECLKITIKHDTFDPQCINRRGDSLLDYLIYRNSVSQIEQHMPQYSEQPILAALLQKKGVSTNQLNSMGLMPLHQLAMESFEQEGVAGWVNQVKSEKNVLEFVETIVSSGANINSTNQDGDTALHLASNNLTQAGLFVALGARTDIKNKDNQTPADASQNPRVTAILNNPEEWIARINDRVLSNTAQELKTSKLKTQSIFDFLKGRQQGQISFNPIKDQCPYTTAVREETAHISSEDMMQDMGIMFDIEDSATDSDMN